MTVSIIVKTLNEEHHIGRTVETALAALSSLGGEVIIADCGSSDDTVTIAARYPVRIVQIVAPALPSCGIGPQLGYQYARYDLVCLIDGDMELDEGFLTEACTFLERHPQTAGVTGHVEEQMLDSLEYARRNARQGPESRIGTIDRMNGGGLYRRQAIESVGYFTDRNLHCHEEFDLGIRLLHVGWKLYRLDRKFVSHHGHSINAYRLLVRRWKSKYLFGVGEFLRAATGQPYFATAVGALPELKLWIMVAGWILMSLVLLLIHPDKLIALLIVLCITGIVIATMSVRKKSVSMGLYTVVAWLFHTAALPIGYLKRRRDPRDWVESQEMEGQNANSGSNGISGSNPLVADTSRSIGSMAPSS